MGGQVPSRVPPNGGRGEWSVVSPRWGKRWNMWMEDGTGFVRISCVEDQGSNDMGSLGLGQGLVLHIDWESEDQRDFCKPVLSHDGRVVLQYLRSGGDARRDGRRSPNHKRRSISRRKDDYYRHDVGSVGAGTRVVRTKTHSDLCEANDRGSDMVVGAGATMFRAEHHSIPRQHQHDQNGIVSQNFVSFYFTNVPDDISYSSLRQGFEVCGIMEDVYLARKGNVNGAVFGFVRYGKVKP